VLLHAHGGSLSTRFQLCRTVVGATIVGATNVADIAGVADVADVADDADGMLLMLLAGFVVVV
jgi:hypothetical protein